VVRLRSGEELFSEERLRSGEEHLRSGEEHLRSGDEYLPSCEEHLRSADQLRSVEELVGEDTRVRHRRAEEEQHLWGSRSLKTSELGERKTGVEWDPEVEGREWEEREEEGGGPILAEPRGLHQLPAVVGNRRGAAQGAASAETGCFFCLLLFFASAAHSSLR
jgi:hypothetical protein